MDLSYEDVQNILKIVDSSSLEELHLEIGDFKLIVRKKAAGGRPGVASTSPAQEAEHAAPTEVVSEASEANRTAGSVAVWPEGGPEPVAVQAVQEAVPARGKTTVRLPRHRGHEVKAPMVGTFYRAPAPAAPPFVEVGSLVTEEDTVCIIEVMKLMNSIKAGCRGRVVEICVENEALVEFGQTLMVIEPVP